MPIISLLPLIAPALFLLSESSPAFAGPNDPPTSPASQVPLRYNYTGTQGQGEYTATEIANMVKADRDGSHFVWLPGWPAWRSWADIPEIAAYVPPPAPPTLVATPPPPPPIERRPPPPPPVITAAPEPPRPTPASPAPEQSAPPTVLSNPPHSEPCMKQLAESRAHHACSSGPEVAVGGEVWFDVAALNMERMGDTTWENDPFKPAFLIGRARFRTDVDITPRVHARMNVDLPQDSSSTVYEIDNDLGTSNNDLGYTTTVRDSADGWTTVVKDLYLDWSLGGAEQRLRVGLQKPIFSSRDWYDNYDAYFLGGIDSYKSLAWSMGVIPSRDLAFSYHIKPASTFSADLQVANGTGEKTSEDNASKDLSGRLVFEPKEFLHFEASALYGGRGLKGEDSLSAYSMAAELRFKGPRIIAEGLMGNTMVSELAQGFLGLAVTGAYHFEVPGETVESLVVLGRYMAIDPNTESEDDQDIENDYDNAGIGNVALQLYWNTPKPRWVLLTGLNYELNVPENALLPVEHSVVGQVAWKF